METIITILIFIGGMFAMSKLGLGCCKGHGNRSDHEGNNSNKSCCSSQKQKVSKDTFEK
ncbi:hypothetical protein [Clostridium tagluense]|uniref:FeoB-associated Cys-rich membrane protein n=1 Tax=Clostridium tagluense TaxID=360422 RepID=A0A401UQN9_9CLOT|nr:hypothetical protein [Clostridium tagluense]GCD11849.1 hypothetical protein Ctaglu_34720 [Clostridium tagluense]